MLEYPIDEAETLIRSKVEEVEQNITTLRNNLLSLKDQITITEVNMARLYNQSVQMRRQAAGAETA